MSNKKTPKSDVPNIGKNTRWDNPDKSPSAGSTIPKPPTSLSPKDSKTKK